MRRKKTMVVTGLHWFILILCHIVLCSHSLRHHRGHSSVPILSSSGSVSGDDDDDPVSALDSSEKSASSPATSLSSSDLLEPIVAAVVSGSKLKPVSSSGGSSSSGNSNSGGSTSSVIGESGMAEIKIKPGRELKLKCELNNTYGRIIWLLNGQSIRTDNGRYSIQGPSANHAIEGRLTINNLLPEDNGVWQCHETKFDGKEHISRPTRVIVLASPRAVHLEFDGRRLSPSSTSSSRVTYREKDNISIDCVVEGGNPPPRIWWFLNSKNLTNNSRVSTTFLEDDKVYLTRSSLRMENVSRTDHNKSLVCIVDHELLSSSSPESSYLRAMAHFNIEYAPSFIISRIPGFGYPIREGIALALKCDIDANPMSRPIWVKDGGEPPVPQSEDGFLNFTTVDRNHTGWYKCISHHPMGKAASVGYYLNVRYEPTIVHQPPARIEASLGERVSMKCDADGRPSPALCWSRIGYGGSLTAVGGGQELILDKILYQEAGNYRCVAQNRLGLEERRAETHDVHVVVTGRPVVYPTNRTIMGFAGQPLSLSVEICANPIPDRAFWIFGGTALRPGSTFRNKYVAQKLTMSESDYCYVAVLTILSVSQEDAGEYMFFVKNSKGIHEGTILLNITQASFSVSTSSSSSPSLSSSSSVLRAYLRPTSASSPTINHVTSWIIDLVVKTTLFALSALNFHFSSSAYSAVRQFSSTLMLNGVVLLALLVSMWPSSAVAQLVVVSDDHHYHSHHHVSDNPWHESLWDEYECSPCVAQVSSVSESRRTYELFNDGLRHQM